MARGVVGREAVVAMVAGALAADGLGDGRLAAAARIVTGRDVDADGRGGFALDAGRDGPATPVDARGMGSWTRLVDAQPRRGEAFVTFPHRSDVGHLYAEGRDLDARQVLPHEARSFLVFPRHPDDGGPADGPWRDLAEGAAPADAHVVLYPAREMEARGLSPYSVTGGAFASGGARAQGYRSWLAFPAHPNDDDEEVARLSVVESDGHRQANWNGGFCAAVTVAAEALEDAGMAEAAAFVRRRYAGRVGGGMVAEEGWFGGGFQVLAIVRGDDDAPLVRQVACVEGAEAVLRHVPSPGRPGEAALVGRVPGERRPLSRCFAFDEAALARIVGGPGTWASRWDAEAASGALAPLVPPAPRGR